MDAPSSVISPPFRADVPRLPPPEIVPDGAAPLEAARLSGGVAAAAGFGLVGFSVVAGVSGPLGWAAALIYFGGLTAYLSQRRLDGKQDFPPTQARPKRDKSTFETPAEAPRKPGV